MIFHCPYHHAGLPANYEERSGPEPLIRGANTVVPPPPSLSFPHSPDPATPARSATLSVIYTWN
jgi:hypothetical protein